MKAVLMNRTFLKLWLGQIVSNVGDWFTYVALIIRLHDTGHGAAAVSGLLICQMVSGLVLGQFGGVFADRFNRRRLMIAVDIGRALLILLASVTYSLPGIYVLVFLCGAGGALFQPALSASVPNIVRREDLNAANSLVSTTYNLGFVAGPALAGILVGKWGVAPALVGDAATFLASAVFIIMTKIPQDVLATGPLNLASAWNDMVDGIRYIAGQRQVRTVIVSLLVIMSLSGMINVIEIYFAKDVLNVGDQGFGYMISGWGLGMVLGSLMLGLTKSKVAPITFFLAAILIQGFGVGMVGFAHHLYFALVFLFIGGFGNGMQGVSGLILIQAQTPDQYRGRVLATRRTLAYTGWVVSMAIGGLLPAIMPLRAIYFVVGLGNWVICLWAVRLLRAGREPAAT